MKGLIQHDAVIVAASSEHAHRSAVIDWGWAHIGHLEYRRPDGLRVRYVSDAGYLRGMPRKMLVFLGGGWASSPCVCNPAWRDLAPRFTVAKTPDQAVPR